MSPEDKARAEARPIWIFEIAQAPRQRLSKQQKDWILETINRLKAPTLVPELADINPD